MTLAATSISVVFAIALFWYQGEKGDQERQEQILLSLAAEARACLDVLGERPAELRGPNADGAAGAVGSVRGLGAELRALLGAVLRLERPRGIRRGRIDGLLRAQGSTPGKAP